MSSSNITIPDDLSDLIQEREMILKEMDKSKGHLNELSNLSNQVPDCQPVVFHSSFSREQTPPAELAAILPELNGELDNINKLSAQIRGRRAEIEQIQRRDKTIIIVIIAAVVLFVFILIGIISS